MKLVYSPKHQSHIPPDEIFNGNREPHAEVPQRAETIKSALEKELQLEVVEPTADALPILSQIHSQDYIDYLASTKTTFTETYEYPSVFRFGHNPRPATHKTALRGFYSIDTYTPVNNTTYDVALTSANQALTAAQLLTSGEKLSYALCRPPGHHAEKSQMGGYCYFNNAAVAAQYLSSIGMVATLDVDIHHGNGTQHIFYDKIQVFTVSIHASPDILYPFYCGRADEVGEGNGVEYNKNYPLEKGITDEQYQKVLEDALQEIKIYSPNYLVVSIGYDTFKDDPIGAFALTTQYYTQMAQTIAQLKVPTVLVQEGGYNTQELGDNAVAFVKGFLK